ncbi:sodium-dependent lysophosphatidylcholine symporter 1-B-like [Amphiura filiformis]|uniref:sodium-dependent lysophosphatidylcholine symporter 1-B-like n=1 Tax=Amphiura filiformis TaxID=82378 RepID=UPI003B212CCF
MGGAPYELTNTVIGFYISIFLLETAKIPPVYTSLIVFIGRIWDGVSDPIVAYLVSRTNSKYGVLKPWMVVGAPLATVAYFCVWYVPETESIGSKVAWYLLFYCAFQTFLTCYQMPFGTYMLFVTDQQDERDSAENFRMGIEMIATIIGTELMGLSLSFSDAHTKQGSGCSANATNVTVPPEVVEFQIKGYMIGAMCICGICLICAIAVIAGTTERISSKPFKIPRDEPFFAALKRVLTFKPWLLHVGAFISFVMALQFMQANFVLFSKYDVGMKNYQNGVILVLVQL